MPHYVAIDLGAGSGRALLGAVGDGRIDLREVHRFRYEPRHEAGHLRWDAAALLDGVGAGLRNAQAVVAHRGGGTIASIGVDSWGVDYGLIDAKGRLLQDPISYRDHRTERAIADVFARIPRAEVFARTGIQVLQLNTLYQLYAHARAGLPPDAAHLLLIPDLCHHFLCGTVACERTNASTTQLLSAESGDWDLGLFETLELPRWLMAPLIDAGTTLGTLSPARAQAIGLTGADPGAIRVVVPATHDTASAVIGTPLDAGWAFVSSGTWSLIGVERTRPLLDAAVAEANFTNERGAFGTMRFLKNVMGLWLLESCRKEWMAAGYRGDMATLIQQVAAVPGFVGFIHPDAARFFNPVSMTREVRAALTETGQPSPIDPARLAKIILDSLALRYASVIDSIERLTGAAVPGLHIVGGGCLNDYLNQATANAAQRPVLAGPVEATAAGNIILQAIADGRLASVADARALMRESVKPCRFEPRDADAWREATQRYQALEH